METTVTEKQHLTPTERVKQELATINVTEQGVAQMKEFMNLKTEAFIDDNEQIVENKELTKQVRAARLQVKATRVAIEKKCKSLRDDANAYLKENRKAELELLTIIEPVEKHLLEQENKADALQTELQAREDKRATELMVKRIEKLRTIKMNSIYGEQFIQIGSTTIANLDLKYSTDEWFEEQFAKINTEVEAEQKRLSDEAEAKRKIDEEIAAQKKLQAEEEQRLAQQKAEQERKEKELDAKFAALKEAEERIEKEKQEKREQRTKMREAQIIALGLRLSADHTKYEISFSDGDTQRFAGILFMDILDGEDDIFGKSVIEIKKTVDEINDLQLAKSEKEIAAAEVRAREQLLKEQEEKAKRDAEEAEKKVAAAARKEARKPDEKKLLEYSEVIRAIVSPELKSSEAIEICVYAEKMLEDVANTIAKKVAELSNK